MSNSKLAPLRPLHMISRDIWYKIMICCSKWVGAHEALCGLLSSKPFSLGCLWFCFLFGFGYLFVLLLFAFVYFVCVLTSGCEVSLFLAIQYLCKKYIYSLYKISSSYPRILFQKLRTKKKIYGTFGKLLKAINSTKIEFYFRKEYTLLHVYICDIFYVI